jgi:NAD(P)-dependent dehydrogenase (short-subunit alcohol dehydrogenase family)
MRRQRRGLIIYISSLLGRITIPFYGPYNASKWALEAIAENYRTELSAFGVESVLVEPGGFPTTFIDHLMAPSDRSREAEYGALAQAPMTALKGFESFLRANPQQDPQLVADAVAELIRQPAGQRPFRTTVDKVGMGDAVAKYNEHLHGITLAIYQNFGTAHMLTLNTATD